MTDRSDDEFDRVLAFAFSKRESPAASATWTSPDATTLPSDPAPSLKPAPPGSLMADAYAVTGELGRGGIGIVLQAKDRSLGRDVAVKVLQARYQENPAALARFTREARIAAQLQHPGIVPVYAAGVDQLDRPYIAMKFLRGSTLEELLAKRRSPEEQRGRYVRIFEQICQTMAYAHAKGVIHRDLKPGNVMVGAFGEVQIIDWGFARVLGTGADIDLGLGLAGAPGDSSRESSTLSVAGSPIGTPAYMAPEQALGDVQALDARTDVFCLGAILCEILTSRPPHASPSVREVMDAAAKGDIRQAHERLERSGGDAELVALAKSCLQPAKLDRPKDAGAVAERVTAILAAAEERARKAELEAVEARARAADERRKKRLGLAAAAGVVVLGAAVVVFLWTVAQRRREAERKVGDILQESREQASKEAWGPAEERVLRAQAVAAATSVGAEVRAGVEEQLAEVQLRRKEHEAFQELHKLRMHRMSAPAEMDRRYADAFRAVGLDLDATEPAEVGRRIRARKGESGERLIQALDDWLLRAMTPARPPRPGEPPPPPQEGAGRAERILEAALAADEHPWRNRLRRALRERNAAEVKALAASLKTEAPPAQSIILLSHAMPRFLPRGPEAHEASMAVLVDGYRSHPADFWISFMIADRSLRHASRDPEGPAADVCERHARLALSLHPENPHATGLLAASLLIRRRPGDVPEAVAWLRKIQPNPDDPFGEVARLVVRFHDGEAEAARAAARAMLDVQPDPPEILRALLDYLLDR